MPAGNRLKCTKNRLEDSKKEGETQELIAKPASVILMINLENTDTLGPKDIFNFAFPRRSIIVKRIWNIENTLGQSTLIRLSM